MNRRWTIASATVIVVAATFVSIRGCRLHVEPAPPSEFGAVEFTLLTDGGAIPFELQLHRSVGVYAQLKLQPAAMLPLRFHDTLVQPPDRWLLCLRCFPGGYSPDGRGAYYGPWRRLTIPGAKLPYVRTYGSHYGWDGAGYTGPPQNPADLKVGELRYWTFLAPPPGLVGRFAYEIVAYPTAYKPPDGGFRNGKPAVLWRGVMEVTETDKPGGGQ